MNAAPTTESALDEALSRPVEADLEAVRALDGDLLILGVSGKMGPTLAALAGRAAEEAGVKRRLVGAARFSSPEAREKLEAVGIETIACDLTDRRAVDALPDFPNVLYMVGQKFGTSGRPSLTWAINACAPAYAAERFAASRIVAFSTGNVYPLTPVASGGPTEQDPPGPVGEYGWSALARERVFEHFSEKNGTPVAILRLNYAIDLRYGVLHDLAVKVRDGEPIDLAMGYVNVIWQRDANSVALRSFALAESPARVINLTGAATHAVRSIANRLGERLGRAPVFVGEEAETALLNNAGRLARELAPETVTLDEMIAWTADWVAGGGRSLGKPTHFEQRDGAF